MMKEKKELNAIYIKVIHHQEKTFILHKPIRVKIEIIDKNYCLSYEPFSIYSNDVNLNNALEDFYESFLAQWNFIVEEQDDKKLSKKAKELKKKMKKIVKEVR